MASGEFGLLHKASISYGAVLRNVYGDISSANAPPIDSLRLIVYPTAERSGSISMSDDEAIVDAHSGGDTGFVSEAEFDHRNIKGVLRLALHTPN